MKKHSGKKTEKSKAATARPPQSPTKKAKSSPTEPLIPSAGTTTPFAQAAASPLSKESESIKSAHPVAKIQSAAPDSPKVSSMASAKVPTAAPVPAEESSRSFVDKSSDTPSVAPVKSAKPAKPVKPGKRPKRSEDEKKPEVKVPSLLLEGDLPPGPGASGPGVRYALAPVPVTGRPRETVGELPEAYGTGRVFLAARDPHWLYVSWDFTTAQQNQFNAQSRDGHLIVRVFSKAENSQPLPEVHVHPESRTWFVHVPNAGTLYHAEVGFYDRAGVWRSAGVSQGTLTPPEAPSEDVSARFATIPADVTFQQVVEAVQQFVTVSKNEPLLEAVASASEAQRGGLIPAPTRIAESAPALPRTSITRIGPQSEIRLTKTETRSRDPIPVKIERGGDWSEEQTRALTKLIHIDSFRRVWLGSMEITELVRLQLQEEMASIAAAEAKRAIGGEKIPGGQFALNVSSPAGGEFPKRGKFWFKINAELIVYGATEPDATVTIADRLIKLRPDGTFSFRFSLPDGRYHLPAIAISSNRQEGREARLEFSRATDYRGEVEAHPQDATLRPPKGENV